MYKTYNTYKVMPTMCLPDGQRVAGAFSVWAESESHARLTAALHMRMILCLAGIL